MVERVLEIRVHRRITVVRHHCLKSGNIQKNQGGRIFLHLCNSLMISMKFDTQKEALLEHKYFM